MRTTGVVDWTPSATLPVTPVSFTGVSYADMLDRARALVPREPWIPAGGRGKG